MYALVDCNNFYVSCERVFQPHLNDKPVIVLSNNDGCAIARSEEAKNLGISMAVPVHLIKDIIEKNSVACFSSNYTLYGDMSRRVMQVLSTFALQVEHYSIDESFLYLKDLKYQSLSLLAKKICATVKRCTGIPVSIGIAPTKTLAKLANRYAKKVNRQHGFYVMDDNDKMHEVLQWAAIGDVWGVGRQHAARLQAIGVYTAYDFTLVAEEWVRRNMSVVGQRLLNELKGIPCIPIDEMPATKKGICTSRSFGMLLTDKKDIAQAVANFAAKCALKLRKQNSCTALVHVFLNTNIFREKDKQLHRQVDIPLHVASNSTSELITVALKGLDMLYKAGYNYHKAGVIVLDIVPEDKVQWSLFDGHDRTRNNSLMKVLDAINKSMGGEVVKHAVQGNGRKWHLKAEYLSPCYTTRIDDILKIKA